MSHVFLSMASKEFWTPWDVETINDIVWDPSSPSAKGKDTNKGKVKEKEKVKLASVAPTGKGDIVNIGKSGSEENIYFVDYEIPILPEKYLASVLVWKRPHELFPNVSAEELAQKIVIYSGKDSELHQYNQHLQASSYYNHILDAFESLRLYEDFEMFDFEGFGFTTWKPTNHIYAMAAVKKGEPHQVEVNPYGKYIIRLYHCGKWRQIQVDDRIPLDYGNKVLLPCIYTNEKLELWPLLISKAILKLNLHHMYDDGHYYIDQKSTHQCRMYDGEKCLCKDYIPVRKYYIYSETELTRMNAIHLLTGWYPEEYEFSGKRSERVWDSFRNFLPQFLYPKRQSQLQLTTPTKGKKKSKKSKSKSKSDDITIDTTETLEVREPHPLVTLDVMLQPIKNSKRNLFMEVNCLLYRDVPLDESADEISNGLPLWKTYRWMYWAAERGIWKPDMQKMFWSVFCSIPEFRHEQFKLLFDQEWIEQINQSKLKRLETLSTTETTKSKSGGMKKQKSGATKKGKSKEITEEIKEEVQPKVWITFKQLLTVLECLKFYHKDHYFRTNIFISNEDLPATPPSEPVAPKTITKPSKKVKGKQSAGSLVQIDPEISYQRVFGEERQPLFMFVDHESEHDALMDLTVLMSERHLNEAKVKIEKYRWNCVKQQLVTELVSTCLEGCRMSLPKGRSAYKISFRAKGFCLHIRSNSPNVKIVDRDTLLELMAKDSILFENYIQGIIVYGRRYAESVGEPDFIDNRYDFFHSLMEYFVDGTLAEIREYIMQNVQLCLFNLVRRNREISRTFRRFLIAPDPNWTFTLTPATSGKKFLQTVKKWQKAKKLACDCPGVKPMFSPEQEKEILECAALKIQSFMKMVYVKQLLRYHDKKEPNRKYCDQLKRDIMAFINKYCTTQSDELRNFIISFLFHMRLTNMSLERLMIPFDPNTRFAEFFEFYEDFHFSVRKVIKTHEVPPNAKAGNWYPLKTGCLFCHSEQSRRYMIRVKSIPETPKITFFVKILNNDDLKMISKSEIASMWPLHQNKYGYKVFIFMFVSADLIGEPAPVLPASWVLEIISPKHAPFAHFCNFCNDTMCPCDQPSADPIFFPLACTEDDLKDFTIYSDVQEASAEVGTQVKYLIKIHELVCLNVFVSSSCELSEFEVKIVQTATRHIVASEADNKVAMIGLYLRPITGTWPQHKSTDFTVTISWLRRARIGSLVSGRSSESTIKSLKFGGQGRNVSAAQSTVDPDRIFFDVKIAYDKGANVEVVAIESDNLPNKE